MSLPPEPCVSRAATSASDLAERVEKEVSEWQSCDFMPLNMRPAQGGT